MTRFKYVSYLIATAIFIFLWQGTTVLSPALEEGETEFCTSEDFATMDKFDAHVHIETKEHYFVDQAKADNFRFLAIINDRPFGTPMHIQEQFTYQQKRDHPLAMEVATAFRVNDWDDEQWVNNTLSALDSAISKGIKAVKIWKNIGLDLRDTAGNFVMVDHPKIDSILDFLAAKNIAVIGHNGEPKDCWLPLDQMAFSRDYYRAHPQYHMYNFPEYPAYEKQIEARDNMLAKHPDIRFLGAHLGSLEWNLDELAIRLDSYPNMWVDLSRMPYIKLHTLNDRAKTQAFFIKYQDRLVYATDRSVSATNDPETRKKQVHEAWLNDWLFFATDHTFELARFGNVDGLKLPKTVVEKLFNTNAKNWLYGQ